jgi:DNA-binding HxlR family transcriptional regulator
MDDSAAAGEATGAGGESGEGTGADHAIPGDHDGGHPARNVLNLLGRAHTMAILYYVAKQDTTPWRFSELEETLGVSPNTLSKRLEELVAAGMLERRSYDEIPPRVEYQATEKALDLDPVFKELRAWADEHGLETGLE